MAVAHGSNHTAGGSTVTSVDVTSVTGGSDQAYVVFVGIDPGGRSVSGVSGGGLTWTQRDRQQAGRNQIAGEVWTAYGTPSSDPFTITVTMDASTTTVSCVVMRVTGADSASLAGWTSRNTNGVDGASTGGTDTATLTIDASVPENDVLVVNGGFIRGNWSAAGTDADYTIQGTQDTGTGGDRVHLRSYTRLVTSGAPFTDTITHTATAVTDWVMLEQAVESASGVAQSITQATETDAAQPLGRVKSRGVGAATGSDAGQPVGRVKARGIGVASEVAAAQPVARVKARAVQSAAVSDVAQPAGRVKSRTAGTAVESDVAQPVAGGHTRTVGPAVEADVAHPVGRGKARVVQPAVEVGEARRLSPGVAVDIGPATGSDVAQPVGRVKSRTVGAAAGVDSAQPVARVKARAVQSAVETSAALPATAVKSRLVAAAVEGGQAQPLGRLRSRPVGPAVETSVALQLGGVKARPLVVAVEAGVAVALAGGIVAGVRVTTPFDPPTPSSGVSSSPVLAGFDPPAPVLEVV